MISFQNKNEQEKLHPGPSAQHIHNKKDLETRTTASSPALPLAGLQKSSKSEFICPDYTCDIIIMLLFIMLLFIWGCHWSDLQIKQIILLRSKKDSGRTSEEQTESDRFTSSISIRLPTRRCKKDTAEGKTLQATNNLWVWLFIYLKHF